VRRPGKGLPRDQLDEQDPLEAAERHAEAGDDQRVAYGVQPSVKITRIGRKKRRRVVRAQRDDQRGV